MAATGSCGGSPSYRMLAKLSRSLLQSWAMGLYALQEQSCWRCARRQEKAGEVWCIYISAVASGRLETGGSDVEDDELARGTKVSCPAGA